MLLWHSFNEILFLFYKLERQPYTVLVLEVLLFTVNFRLVKERHMAGLIHRDVGQIVLAGDHKQLGPVLQSAAARFVFMILSSSQLLAGWWFRDYKILSPSSAILSPGSALYMAVSGLYNKVPKFAKLSRDSAVLSRDSAVLPPDSAILYLDYAILVLEMRMAEYLTGGTIS